MADINQEMQGYKIRRDAAPDIKKLEAQYDPTDHEVFKDLFHFKDRYIDVEYEDENGKKQTKKVRVPLNRIGLPYQKYIVKVAVTFLFGNPVKYTNNIDDNTFYDAFKKVIAMNKMQFIDREIAQAVSKYTECAEFWYDYDGKQDYTFNSPRTIKVKILTPDKEKLYPVFDSRDDLISFGREFTVKGEEKDYTVFEVYTKDKIIKYSNETGTFVKEEQVNPLKKIPIVYYRQPEVEWEDVQSAIHRLEKIFMNAAESNDKFAFPILGIYGEVEGSFSGDRSGKVLQFKSAENKAEFVVPPNANENLKDEVDRLDDAIHTFTSTPNVFSFSKIQGMGNMLAGENAKFIFLSAHLKVMEKAAIYVPGLQRRISIIKSYLQFINVNFKDKELDVEPIITPFVIDNEMEYARFLMEMTGSKQLFSQEYAMQKMGIKDPQKMMDQINAEAEKQASNQLM